MVGKFLGKILVAIDVGTTKICVLVASISKGGRVSIIGMGQHPSIGLKKGVVVNIKQTVESIRKAVKKAEEMSGVKIDSAVIGISGGHIKSFNSTGVVAIKGGEVTSYDIDRVIDAARAVAISKDHEILHVLPQYFRVDGQDYVLDSLGMYGVRLESQVHIITGAISSAQNLIKACELAGVRVKDIVLEQLASAEAVLTPSERELGVGILDIGGGTSDFAVYREGRIVHTKVLPFAGNHFTNDLAVGLGIPIEEAERLKIMYGFVEEEKYLELDTDKIKVDLGYEGGHRNIETYTLYEILNPRAEEIFDLLLSEIIKYKLLNFIPAGLVLTGGGSLMRGIRELAIHKLKTNVRLGIPSIFSEEDNLLETPDILKSPIYATAYGLILYALNGKSYEAGYPCKDSVFRNVFERMKSWIWDIF